MCKLCAEIDEQSRTLSQLQEAMELMLQDLQV